MRAIKTMRATQVDDLDEQFNTDTVRITTLAQAGTPSA